MDILRGGSRTSLLLLVLAACGSLQDEERLYEPGVGALEQRPQAFLNFPPDVTGAPRPEEDVPGFPRLLSETGAFTDVARLEPAPGLIPYDLQAPLWSDGATKVRWVAVPEGTVHVPVDAAWQFPEGTVFVKHFEMALDERDTEARRRLETRLLVSAAGGTYYGVTYKWNAEETDAELLLEPETEMLPVIDTAGENLDQPYFYPGPRDCNTCHSSGASYVLGPRTRQLNREFEYRSDWPPINQLVAWSGWGLLDRGFDNTEAEFSPRLAHVSDENEDLEWRVRSYWDGNCSMCHAGAEGSVPGWDARFETPLEEQGLLNVTPRSSSAVAPLLISPGDPEHSYLYLRGNTVELGLRMPPLGRNRIDAEYLDVLARWIASLPPGDPESRAASEK